MSTNAPDKPLDKPSWKATSHFYLEPPTVRMLLLGFSAGLPLQTCVWFALLTVFGPATRDLAQDALRSEVFWRGADAAGRSGRGAHR